MKYVVIGYQGNLSAEFESNSRNCKRHCSENGFDECIVFNRNDRKHPLSGCRYNCENGKYEYIWVK